MKKQPKIFYASHDQGNHSPESRTWYNNLYLPLMDVSSEITRFSHDLFPMSLHQDFIIEKNQQFISNEKEKISTLLLNEIKEAHTHKGVDIFFSYFASSYCYPEVIDEIRNMGIMTVNWFCNASYQFYLVEDIAPHFDYCLVPEKFMLESYTAAGANPYHFQESANPRIYQRKVLPSEYDITFIGGRYANRFDYIRVLYNQNIDIHAFGEKWISSKTGRANLPEEWLRKIMGKLNPSFDNLHGFVSDEEMVNIFNQSKINLGFSICGNTHLDAVPIRQVRLRDFEIPMAGGFYLSEINPELEEFFEPEKEVIFFADTKECIDKTHFYLKNENLRKEIALAAWKRAQAEHTTQKRLEDFFTAVGVI